MDGSTHKQVVDLIKSGGDYLTLIGWFFIYYYIFIMRLKCFNLKNKLVIAMPSDEINRVTCENQTNSDDSSCNSNDYSDRRAVPIKISDYAETKNAQRDKFIVFNITLNGKHLCGRRYKEFDIFHALLKREFNDFSFPNFPKKWPFKLTEQQLEARRRSLENYLEIGKPNSVFHYQ